MWAISTKKDSVWLKWIHSVYLKGVDWWGYVPKASSSWYWMKLCQIKEQLKQIFSEADFKNMVHYSVKKVYDTLVKEQERINWDNNSME